jgi:hypothetical protein
MVFSVPPLMILIPAALPLGVQVSPPIIGFTAVIALVMDRSVGLCLRLFNCVLALVSVIGVHQGRRHKQQKRSRYNGCHCCFSKSSIQDYLLSFFNVRIFDVRTKLARFYEKPGPFFDTVILVVTALLISKYLLGESRSPTRPRFPVFSSKVVRLK